MTGPSDPDEPGGEPQYQPEQYPGQYPGHYPPPYGGPPLRRGGWDRIGPRALQRPQPRLGVTLGGTGVGLVVIGVLVWSLTYLAQGLITDLSASRGSVPDDSRKYLGALLGLAVVIAGYALVIRAKSGALRAAGVTATVLGVPVAVEFFTLSLTVGDPSDIINIDAVFWVSLLVYLVSYLFVPRARGHSPYLGYTLLLIWSYIVSKVDDDALRSLGASAVRVTPVGGSGDLPAPDLGATSIAVTSLVIGAVYHGAAFLSDRRGRHGVAVPFLVAGIPVTVIGIVALLPDLHRAGTGVFAIVVGFALAAYGALFERRFTTWFWAGVSAVGVILLVSDIADTGTGIGVTLVVLGAVSVAGGWWVGRLLGETPDIDEGVEERPVAPARKH